MEKVIALLPHELKFSPKDFAEEEFNFPFDNGDPLFFQSGKNAIRYLMIHLGLKAGDEVFITTTSGSPFVSSCVTSTIFNYSGISRVLSPKTKAIFVIHEFGFPHPEIEALVKIAGERNIPLIEDSAHSVDSFYKNKRIGTFGDYALFSLPKSLPVNFGGMLTGKELPENNRIFDPAIHSKVKSLYLDNKNFIPSFSGKRRENYLFLRNGFNEPEEVYDFNTMVNPFVYSFKTEKFQRFYEHLDDPRKGIELGRTYNENWVTLPVNPLLKKEKLQTLIEEGNRILSDAN